MTNNTIVELNQIEVGYISGGSALDTVFAISLSVLVNIHLKTKNPGIRAGASAISSILGYIVTPEISKKLIEPNPFYKNDQPIVRANNTGWINSSAGSLLSQELCLSNL